MAHVWTEGLNGLEIDLERRIGNVTVALVMVENNILQNSKAVGFEEKPSMW